MLTGPQMRVTMGAYDALAAKIIECAGFDCIWDLRGFSGADSIGAPLASPPCDVRQYEQVHTGKKHQGEGSHRQEAHPVCVPVFKHCNAVEDDDQRKGNGQPAVQLPNPFAPVQWDLLSKRRAVYGSVSMSDIEMCRQTLDQVLFRAQERGAL